MGFFHQPHIVFKDFRVVKPLVRIIVTAVQKMRKTRGRIHERASICA